MTPDPSPAHQSASESRVGQTRTALERDALNAYSRHIRSWRPLPRVLEFGMSRPFPLKVLLPLALGVIVSIAILVFSEFGYRRLDVANRQSTTALETQARLNDVVALVVDAEGDAGGDAEGAKGDAGGESTGDAVTGAITTLPSRRTQITVVERIFCVIRLKLNSSATEKGTVAFLLTAHAPGLSCGRPVMKARLGEAD